MDRCRNGPGFHNDIDGNSTVQELLIPASKVGLVIGKGGETIKQLQVREPREGLRLPPLPASGGLSSRSLPGRPGCACRGPELPPPCRVVPRFLRSTAVFWTLPVARPGAGMMSVLGLMTVKLWYRHVTASQMERLQPEPAARPAPGVGA